MIRVQPTLKASRNKSPPYHKKAALLMAEIQRSPAEVGSLSHLFSGIYRYYIYIYPRWLARFLPSTVLNVLPIGQVFGHHRSKHGSSVPLLGLGALVV